MKRIKYMSVLALSALMGLWSCSVDTLSTSPNQEQSNGRKVTLTLSGVSTGKTRAANLGGFDREKAINGSKLYAVVFDQQGKFSKTYPITDYETTGNTCSFTLDDAGVYYGYIVANTSKGTELADLTKGTSTEDDFFNIIEDTDPGADLASSTNFFMVSRRTLLDVDGDADTSLGTVTLTRCVARIDIDATAITGLAITKVEVQNRYKKTLLVRGNIPADATLSAATPTDTKTYTRGTNSGEVPALDGTTAGQDHALVTDQEWQGVIYCYENIDPTSTVVKITHTLNGVASTTTVNFADANVDPSTSVAAGQAVKRNNIYTVKLIDGAPSPTLNDIQSTITVTDWDTSTNLSYTALTDHEKPDYEVTSGNVAYGFTEGTKNPSRIIAKSNDDPSEITLQITSNGKIASEVSFVNKSGVAYDFMGDGGAITQTSLSITDNKIVQNYTITIPKTILLGLGVDGYITFKVHNVFDDTSTGSREFVVKYKDIKMNPLWWCGEYNLDTGMSSFDETLSTSQGYMFMWTTLMASKFAYQNTGYDGWKEFSATTEANRTIGGVVWHLPTQKEYYSIIPSDTNGESAIGTNATAYYRDIIKKGDVNSAFNEGNLTGTSASDIQTEYECVFGFDATTKDGIVSKSFWSDTYVNETTQERVRYAIRFIGTNYCSAWRYQVLDHGTTTARLVISSRLIDVIAETDYAGLATEMKNMKGDDPNYWSTSNMTYDMGGVTRSFYLCGHGMIKTSANTEQHSPGYNAAGNWCYYWTASQYGSNYNETYGYTNKRHMIIGINTLSANRNELAEYPFVVRLFRDK